MGTKNTDLVANFEATPQVKNNAAELHGVLRTAHGTVELAAGDSDNDDIVMLAPIPSNAAVPSLFIGSDTFGGSCTFNVGIYTTDGTVKDEASFAVLGGESEIILERFESLYKANMTLAKSLSACIEALCGDGRKIDPGDLEVAELSIENGRRAFRRITGTELEDLII